MKRIDQMEPDEGHREHREAMAYLITDVQLSRQFRKHFLKLPGEEQPRWCGTLDEALDTAAEEAQEVVILCVSDVHYPLAITPGVN